MAALPVTTDALLPFLAVALAVLVTPGPSLFLIASASLGRGWRAGLVAVAGTELGIALVTGAVVAGLGTVLARFGGVLGVLRWLGVAWLAVAGLRALLGPAPPTTGPTGTGFWAALLVAVLNPSTTPFLLATLPQFIDPARPPLPQLATLGIAFLALATGIDCACAATAARLAPAWTGSGVRRRATGLLLIGAALLLALARA